MESDEAKDDGPWDEYKESSGTSSPSGSLASSLSSSQDFRRQMKPPNRKKYEESMDEVTKQIRTKETEQKSWMAAFQEKGQQLRGVRSEREAAISKRKKIDGELRLLNQDITKKMGSLSRVESNLHYKNEAKIDDAIRNMEWQLKTQNFRLAEEKKIVAEIDKLKRSKKVLVEYFAQKSEVDKIRENQRRMRGERDYYNKTVHNLGKREEEFRKLSREAKVKGEENKQELNQLYEKKRELFSEFKQNESDFQKMVTQKRHKQKKESFRKREEDRKAKEEALWQERLKFEALKEPFQDEKNLCNTLISYLQRYTSTEREEHILPSPRDEQPEHPIGSTPGPADSLDDGMFVRLKKSEDTELDYTVSSKRPMRRSRKGRKLSVTKPLAHTPQIIAQFSSLNLNAPSNMSEVPASVEQLQARKRYYEEQAASVPRPLLGNLSGSFSSSGSMSSLDSPLRERSSTWGFVEVPPAIAEHQTQSDAGTSADTGFHDMSRQASKTESSESATDCQVSDQVLAEIINQKPESDYSRSSSDTITPDEHLPEESEASAHPMSQSQDFSNSSNQGNGNENFRFDNVGFDNSGNSVVAAAEKLSMVDQRWSLPKSEIGAKIVNYDDEFPPVLFKAFSEKTDVIQSDEATKCDKISVIDSPRDKNMTLCDTNANLPNLGSPWSLNQNNLADRLKLDLLGDKSFDSREHMCPKIIVSEDIDIAGESIRSIQTGVLEESEGYSSDGFMVGASGGSSRHSASEDICSEDIVTHL